MSFIEKIIETSSSSFSIERMLAGGKMSSVLLVEDNSTFRKSLKEMLALRFPEMVIDEASDGEEALQKLENTDPDLIFMDIRLPGKNGLEVTRIIKKTNPGVEVVILTSYDITEYRVAAFNSGASHFFTKGNSGSDEIADFVRSALQRKGRAAEASHRAGKD
ncbi:Response regulator receiver protein (modular protein) [Syntrophobacter sp. SbD1]|nr:Response regulator receiver protein (modular protein) [Syntrophobacter sp. SbD1]